MVLPTKPTKFLIKKKNIKIKISNTLMILNNKK